jgi:hypothetical protein
MYRKQLLALAGIAGVGGFLITAPAAHAVTTTFGYSVGGGAVTNAGSGTTGVTNSGNVAAGTWNFTATGAQGFGIQDSNSINVSDATGGTLYVFVTFSGISAPVGSPALFLSSFTLNSISGTASVVEKTFVDSGNSALPSNTGSIAGTLIGSSPTFTSGPITAQQGGSATTGSLYSVTEEYIITATGATFTNATIDVQETPLPAALPLFAGGLGVIGLLARRSKKKGKAVNPLA